MLAGDQSHVAAAPAVPAARSAPGDELLPPERKTAVAAVAGFHEDFYFIDEQLLFGARIYSGGCMLTNLPSRPRSRKWMTPVIFANNVSSFPRPTLSPGLMRVPRCRTRIDPPGTNCPPNAFTPRRCEFESRPFLELPRPVLCAITTSSQRSHSR